MMDKELLEMLYNKILSGLAGVLEPNIKSISFYYNNKTVYVRFFVLNYIDDLHDELIYEDFISYTSEDLSYDSIDIEVEVVKIKTPITYEEKEFEYKVYREYKL